MATTAQNILDYMHQISLTSPASSDFPKLKGLVGRISIAPSRESKFHSWSDNDIHNLVHFLVGFIDAPPSLRGFYKIQKALTILAADLIDRVTTDDIIKNEVMAIVHELFNAIRSSPPSDFVIFDKPPYMFESPLFYFHYCAHIFSIIDAEGYCPLYEAYGLLFHLAIRNHEAKKPNEHTHEGRILACRHFFEYLSFDNKSIPAELQPEEVPDEYIDDAMLKYSRQEDGTASELSKTAKVYQFSVRAILKDYPLKRRRSTVAFQNIDSDEDLTVYPDDLPGGLLLSSKEQYLEASNDDYPLPTTLADTPGESIISDKKPYLKSHWSDFIHLRNFTFYWDSDYLTLMHYSVLYYVLADMENDTSPAASFFNVVSLFIYILMHTGIPPKLLIHLSTAPQNPENDIPELRQISNRYYIVMPLIIHSAGSESRANCRTSLQSVFIPLPDKACELIRKIELPTAGPVFSFPHKNNNVKVDLDMIRDFLNKKVNRSKLFAKYNLRITATRIYRSFPALYSSRFGFDPLMCAVLKADKSERLYKSQSHYVYIFRRDIETKYIKTFQTADNAVLANLNRCVSRGIIPDLTRQSIILSNDNTVLDIEYHSEGYGSSILPSEDYVSDIITRLTNAIRFSNNKIQRFNLFSIYVYLCAQFSFGLRPHKIFEISWRDYNARNSLMVVRDKDSAEHFEERILPAPPVLHELLLTLKRATRATRRYISTDIRPAINHDECDSMFLFFDDKGFISEFKMITVISHLRSIGVDYDLRPNMPRHFLKNTLYHDGISNDQIDVYMGHTHAGRELHNIASSSCLDPVVKQCLPVISRMLERLGFKHNYLWQKEVEL